MGMLSRAAARSGLLALALPGLLLLTCLMSGCASDDRDAHANALAARGGLRRELIDTDSFVLTAYARISRPGEPLHLYIEGDGLAWISRNQPSLDPTPREATGLALAAADPAPNVVYLARPCQYTPMAMNPRCALPYWTGKRYARECRSSVSIWWAIREVVRWPFSLRHAALTSPRFARWRAISTTNLSTGCIRCRRCRLRKIPLILRRVLRRFRRFTSAVPAILWCRPWWRSALFKLPAHGVRRYVRSVA
jgi:hypothetical protein